MFTSSFIHITRSHSAHQAARYSRRLLYQIILLFSISHTVYSQPLLFPSSHKRYVIKTINIENGLQNNTVGDIITDTFGFTWVGTKTGLQRYNGYRLESVQPVINGQPLNIDYQMYFLQTNNHMIWMACKEGILQYNPFLGTFSLLVHYSSPDGQPALRPLGDTREGVWCAGCKSLLLFDHKGKRLREVLYPSPFFATLPQRLISAVNSRYIFLLTDPQRVVMFDKRTFTFSWFPHSIEAACNMAATENRIYLFQQQGISVYKTDSGAITKLNTFSQTNRFDGTIKIFGKGILANIDQHLLYLDSNCTHANEIATLNGGSFLMVGFVKYIYQDLFNRLWIITSNDVRVILNYAVPFQYFAYKDAINYSKSIYADDEENRVLAGFYNGGIQLFDTLNNPLWNSPLVTDKVKDVAGIEKLGKDEYFITTIGQGWYTLDVLKKVFTPVLLSPEEEGKYNTHGIVWTNNLQRLGDAILVTTPSGILQCRFSGNRLTSINFLFHDANKQIYYSHYNEVNACLLIGTSSGLVYNKHPDGRIDTIATPGSYQVRCLTTDAQNNAWIGTDKGLFVYDKKNMLIKSFTSVSGLLNDCIYSILTDKEKRTIYASSNLGLSAINLNGVLKNYTKERGLQENEFNSAATALTAKGKLYFGGVNGVTAFYPSDITMENDHPSLLIYKTDINDETYTSDSATWNTQAYQLSYNEDKISFSLTAFGIYQASDYAYEYKMENFDRNWTTTNNPVNISYHLPPGTYTFKARLINFPSQIITRYIVVSAPFWQRWWFYGLMFLLLISVVWAMARTLYQKRYKEELQRLQIRQQVLAERERISRDLHDNIGAYASAISANVDEVIYGTANPNPLVLKKLKESAREIIVQLRDSIWALNKETQTVIMLSDRIKNYVQKLQPAYPSISFDVEEEVTQNANFPSLTALHVLRIVQEAVHNAIKHSGCTVIQINISSRSPVVISVADNGRGMPASPVYGDGVKNMQARAADIGWQVMIESQPDGCTVQITDTNS